MPNPIQQEALQILNQLASTPFEQCELLSRNLQATNPPYNVKIPRKL